MRNAADKIQKIMFIVFAVIGIVLLLVGIIFAIYSLIIIDDYEIVNGQIHNIKYEGSGNYLVSVVFNYQNAQYVENISSYSSSYYVGKPMELYVLFQNDTIVSVKILGEFILFPLIFSIIGSVFSFTGLGFFISLNIKKKNNRKIKESGSRVIARVSSVEVVRYYSVNNIHPFVLKCYCGMDENKKNFKSEFFWNPILDYENKVVNVYVLGTKYYVDLDSIRENNEEFDF